MVSRTERFKYKIHLTYKIMTEILDIGKISSRGQVAIPSEIRSEMGIYDGEKVLFILRDGVLVIRKVDSRTISELTGPLRKMEKKIDEKDVPKLVHRLRKL